MTGPANDRSLDAALTRLPDPAPPIGLAAGTMARIARLDDGPGAHRRREVPATAARTDRLAAIRAILGQAAGVAALGYVTLASGLAPVPPRIGGLASLVPMPATAPLALVLAAGLLLYVAGLFAPLQLQRLR